jgi:hypothetical protein
MMTALSQAFSSVIILGVPVGLQEKRVNTTAATNREKIHGFIQHAIS